MKSFWITNISKKNVSLGDLNLTVPAFSSINLLDKKHYHLTEEQLINSAKNGSLYVKRSMVVVRKVPPYDDRFKNHVQLSLDLMPRRDKSVFELKTEKFEELDVTDEEYAVEDLEEGNNTFKKFDNEEDNNE